LAINPIIHSRSFYYFFTEPRTHDNIIKALKNIRYKIMDWILMAHIKGQCQALENSKEPSGSTKDADIVDQLSG
jgi:hypothetical protein